ncbi:MAG: DNA-3-methyladenine glycosylase I [Pseudomonadota bacterium]
MVKINRCGWCEGDSLYIKYHDKEWGVPVRRDKKLFEFLILEGVQAGLSWITVLKKRRAYREALDQFDYKKIATYNDKKLAALLKNPDLIRNRLKMKALTINANAFLHVRKEHGTFSRYIWQFTDGRTVHNEWRSLSQVPAKTSIAEAMSNDLKRRGFKFVGPTICYAFMQATGMVNDHIIDCFRHQEIVEQCENN